MALATSPPSIRDLATGNWQRSDRAVQLATFQSVSMRWEEGGRLEWEVGVGGWGGRREQNGQ